MRVCVCVCVGVHKRTSFKSPFFRAIIFHGNGYWLDKLTYEILQLNFRYDVCVMAMQ